MQITAAVKYADRDTFSIEQLELEAPRAKEILVKIAGVGLCHTDIVFSGRTDGYPCLLYTSPSPRDQRGSRMPSSA